MPRLHGQQATDDSTSAQARPPLRLQISWVIIGVSLDWRLAFEWFAGKSPFFSGTVMDLAVLIVLACAVFSVFAVCVTPEARWRRALPLFCALSGMLYAVLSVHWDVQRR